MAFIALVSLVCGMSATLTGCGNYPLGSGQDFGSFPTKGEVIGAAFGLAGGVAAVAIAVHHSHHTVKGCILSGPAGLEVQDDRNSPLELKGVTADLKVGDRYRLHGSKLKKAKHAPGNSAFLVEKIGKDFGPCTTKPHELAASATFR